MLHFLGEETRKGTCILCVGSHGGVKIIRHMYNSSFFPRINTVTHRVNTYAGHVQNAHLKDILRRLWLISCLLRRFNVTHRKVYEFQGWLLPFLCVQFSAVIIPVAKFKGSL